MSWFSEVFPSFDADIWIARVGDLVHDVSRYW